MSLKKNEPKKNLWVEFGLTYPQITSSSVDQKKIHMPMSATGGGFYLQGISSELT